MADGPAATVGRPARAVARLAGRALYRAARLVLLLLLALTLVRTPLLNHLLYFPMAATGETPALAGAAYEDVLFRTADGETLHGWWIPSRRGPALAHVVFAHGNAGTVADRIEPAVLLADRGMDVFVFDYRGYGRSTGRPDEQGTYRDARAAREAALGRGADPGRLVYLGESLGGAVALELATAHPPAGLVLMYTFTSVRDLARLHYPFIPPPIVPNAYPSLDRIRGVRTPVLVVHGADDDLIPIAHGQALFEAAPEPKRFLEIAGAGHNDLFLVAGPRWADAVADWVRTSLPAVSSAP